MISKQQYTIDINAESDIIWKALWEDASYRDWTSVFSEGSHAVSDHWKEGSIVLFLGADKGGIYSLIETHIPNKTITFKHIGMVVNGEQQPIDEETKTWSGTTESYTIKEGKGFNTLIIDIDIMDKHLKFMNDVFPKALEKIKKNSEAK